MTRDLDLVLFGASGFTGRLVAEVLQGRHVPGGLRWALAGRRRERLEAVRDAIGAPASLPLQLADAADPAALEAIVRRARVVLTTVGPYQRHGEALATACAQAGTDYVDLCGEPPWMARMIPRLQPLAAASGARIVFSCGFDSIPFDLGVVFLQHAMQQRFGLPAREVRARVTVMKGKLSGGTAASALATLDAVARDPALARVMADPYALVEPSHPGLPRVPQPDDDSAAFDDWAGTWTGPFAMAPINVKNVHRTHALRGRPWGDDFVYSERLQTGPGAIGEQRAKSIARVQRIVLALGPARSLVGRYVLPKPGEGPDRAAREAGRFEVVLIGQTASGARLAARVRGDRDPGYGSTSRMVSEAALCLLEDMGRGETPGGVWTAGAAMGLALVRRLEAHAGVGFEILD